MPDVIWASSCSADPTADFQAVHVELMEQSPVFPSNKNLFEVYCQVLGLPSNFFEEQKRMTRRVVIKKDVDPNDKRIGTVIEDASHRLLVEWSPICRRWEYKVNLETFVVGRRVTVARNYVTGVNRFGSATLTPSYAKVVYIHGDHAAVIFEDCNTLGTVLVSELTVVE